MPTPKERKSDSSDVYRWQTFLPLLMVFSATFLLFGMLWPAMSPGVRASVSVDFCLPLHISSLSESETKTLETLVANQVSSELSGSKFDSLIWQTKRTGRVNSSAIEYFDHETINQNIGLAFAFYNEGGQVEIEYTCQGHSDQLRFLQLMGQRVANSIDRFFISKSSGLVAGKQLDVDSFDRAIWLANQVQTDLGQIQNNHGGSDGNSNSPYSFASTNSLSLDQQSETKLNSIDTDSLINVLNEIKDQTFGQETHDGTFSVFKVGPVKLRAINGTPRGLALLGLIAMSCLVTGLVAMNQFAANKPTINVNSLSETLGVPVVAVLPNGSKSKPSNDEFVTTVAQSLITLSKFFLFFAVIVIFTFVILDSSIREAFFQNPFDGLAKIFGVFFGYA